jgi:HSP20 family protein
MMDEMPAGYLRQLEVRLGRLALQLARVRVPSIPVQHGWCPPINAYHSRTELIICVDLAGVDREGVELQVEPLRLLLRGHRHPPGPEGLAQIIALEIDHGPFEREIPLPAEVSPQEVRAEQRQGILWIHLPFAQSLPSNPTGSPLLP